MPSIGTCFRFYTQMRVEKKTKLLPIKLKTVYTTVHVLQFPGQQEETGSILDSLNLFDYCVFQC